MAAAGCNSIEFGAESGSDRVLRSIGKGITVTQIQDAVNWALKANLKPSCGLMVGHPEDDRVTIRQTIELARTLKRGGCLINHYITVPFPGTQLFSRAKELGIEILTDNWDDFQMNNAICHTKYLRADEIRSFYFELAEAAECS
jgi:radical SAM superfamily enzyme YgiQ (UPF0313 family)